MIVKSSSSSYSVGTLVGEMSNYRLYKCRKNNDERELLLQIPIDISGNGNIDRNAYFLNRLKIESDLIEEEYAKVKESTDDMLNYHFCFPELVDSFICSDQGNRVINVIAFRGVQKVEDVFPTQKIISGDHYIDYRTSAWIMGKILKLLVFTQSLKISVGMVDTGNILIVPNRHFVMIFDWSEAKNYDGLIPSEVRSEEISLAAHVVIDLLGGDYITESFPKNLEEGCIPYSEYLFCLAKGGQKRAKKAHEQFYEIIEGLWGRKFHPFTYI